MTPIQAYEASVEAAKANLEAARGALSRDVAHGVAGANWAALLRDKFDVQALIEHIGEATRSKDWVNKLHALADKARQQQPSRGRPPKPTTQTPQKRPAEQTNAGANSGATTPANA